MEDDESCCLVCYEPIEDIYRLNIIDNNEDHFFCEHWFCKGCAEKILNKDKKCPYCLKEANSIRIDKLASFYAKKAAMINSELESIDVHIDNKKNENEDEISNELKMEYEKFENEKQELRRQQEQLESQLSDFQNRFNELTNAKNKEIIELQMQIDEKNAIVEEEKRKLMNMQKDDEKSNDEIIKLKEKIETLNNLLHDDAQRKKELLDENEIMKEKFRTQKKEFIQKLLSQSALSNHQFNNNNINLPNHNHNHHHQQNINNNGGDKNDNNDHCDDILIQNGDENNSYFDLIYSYLANGVTFFTTTYRGRSIDEYRLLEGKGNSKKSLVRKALLFGCELKAIKLIRKKSDSNLLQSYLTNSFKNFTRLNSLWMNDSDLTQYRESMFLCKLDHPNILPLSSFVHSTDGREFIEMPYYEYDIEYLRYQQKLETKNIIEQLLNAIAYLHSNSAVHRSLTPDCLLTSEITARTIVIGSFSNAISLHNVGSDMSFMPSNLVYSAPELLYLSASQIPITRWEKADLWSIGCIFAFLLLGRNLFSGFSQNLILKSIFSFENCRPSHFQHLPSDTSQLLRETPVQFNFANIIPNASEEELDLLSLLLQFEAEKRPSAQSILQHKYFHHNDDDLSISKLQFSLPNKLGTELRDEKLPSFIQTFRV